jgi:hypothetical protein
MCALESASAAYSGPSRSRFDCLDRRRRTTLGDSGVDEASFVAAVNSSLGAITQPPQCMPISSLQLLGRISMLMQGGSESRLNALLYWACAAVGASCGRDAWRGLLISGLPVTRERGLCPGASAADVHRTCSRLSERHLRKLQTCSSSSPSLALLGERKQHACTERRPRRFRIAISADPAFWTADWRCFLAARNILDCLFIYLYMEN